MSVPRHGKIVYRSEDHAGAKEEMASRAERNASHVMAFFLALVGLGALAAIVFILGKMPWGTVPSILLSAIMAAAGCLMLVYAFVAFKVSSTSRWPVITSSGLTLPRIPVLSRERFIPFENVSTIGIGLKGNWHSISVTYDGKGGQRQTNFLSFWTGNLDSYASHLSPRVNVTWTCPCHGKVQTGKKIRKG